MKTIKITHSFQGKIHKETDFYRAWITPYGYILQRKEDGKFLKFQGSFLFKFFLSNELLESTPNHVCFISNKGDEQMSNPVILQTKDSISKKEYDAIMEKATSWFEGYKEVNNRYPSLPEKVSFEVLDDSIQISE